METTDYKSDTDKEIITMWFEQGKCIRCTMTHMFVAYDAVLISHFPVYVRSDENVRTKYENYDDEEDGQRVIEDEPIADPGRV